MTILALWSIGHEVRTMFVTCEELYLLHEARNPRIRFRRSPLLLELLRRLLSPQCLFRGADRESARPQDLETGVHLAQNLGIVLASVSLRRIVIEVGAARLVGFEQWHCVGGDIFRVAVTCRAVRGFERRHKRIGALSHGRSVWRWRARYRSRRRRGRAGVGSRAAVGRIHGHIAPVSATSGWALGSLATSKRASLRDVRHAMALKEAEVGTRVASPRNGRHGCLAHPRSFNSVVIAAIRRVVVTAATRFARRSVGAESVHVWVCVGGGFSDTLVGIERLHSHI